VPVEPERRPAGAIQELLPDRVLRFVVERGGRVVGEDLLEEKAAVAEDGGLHFFAQILAFAKRVLQDLTLRLGEMHRRRVVLGANERRGRRHPLLGPHGIERIRKYGDPYSHRVSLFGTKPLGLVI